MFRKESKKVKKIALTNRKSLCYIMSISKQTQELIKNEGENENENKN